MCEFKTQSRKRRKTSSCHIMHLYLDVENEEYKVLSYPFVCAHFRSLIQGIFRSFAGGDSTSLC